MKALIRIALGLSAIFILSAPVVAAGLDDIPADIRQRLYDPKMIDPAQPIGPSAYVDWKPKHGPPWRRS
jgi:ribose transport system substrate-binding protein